MVNQILMIYNFLKTGFPVQKVTIELVRFASSSLPQADEVLSDSPKRETEVETMLKRLKAGELEDGVRR